MHNLCSDLEKTVRQPQVCQVITSINEDTGGTAVYVTYLAEALCQQDINSHLFTLDYPFLGQQIQAQGIKLHSYPATTVARQLGGLQLKANRALCDLAASELDLIHNHGLWLFPNLYARKAAKSNHLPLVISPAGMLEAWSLRRSQIRKRLAWQLYERKNLASAVVFHATCIAELNSIRQLGFTQPIAVIPYGLHLPDISNTPSKEILIQSFPELVNKHWLLFLSRIHPKKGLDMLLRVWRQLSPRFQDWHLVIAGPDEIGYQAKLVALTSELGLEQRVTFTGMLSGERKAAALSNAELFVLPTHSENFGIAIAESLAYGVPTIVTKGAPWQDLESHKCGWWIENNEQILADTLTSAMGISSSERQAMGIRGRNLMKTKFSWNSISKEMSNVYHWILAGGESPSCVHFHSRK